MITANIVENVLRYLGDLSKHMSRKHKCQNCNFKYLTDSLPRQATVQVHGGHGHRCHIFLCLAGGLSARPLSPGRPLQCGGGASPTARRGAAGAHPLQRVAARPHKRGVAFLLRRHISRTEAFVSHILFFLVSARQLPEHAVGVSGRSILAPNSPLLILQLKLRG